MITKVKKIILKLNDRGRRIGESHQCKPKLTDAQVDMIRDLYEEGFHSQRTLARMYEVSRQTIAMICRYERRAHSVADFKTVHVKQFGEDTH